MADVIDFSFEGVLRKRWNDNTERYTEWDAAGVQTLDRAYTALELSQKADRIAQNQFVLNKEAIETAIKKAFLTNRTYLALTSPTAAQNTAEIQALARQMNGVFRYLLNQFDGTN